jgi:hypothetical protein
MLTGATETVDVKLGGGVGAADAVEAIADGIVVVKRPMRMAPMTLATDRALCAQLPAGRSPAPVATGLATLRGIRDILSMVASSARPGRPGKRLAAYR